jgi:hypothetical protein
LANIYLHYVFDLWIQRWRTTRAKGDVVVVRFADDFLVGFQHRAEAEQFLAELRERLGGFGLELHRDKTHLLRFGRKAAGEWRHRGGPKPGTFDFLGFTHTCGRTRKGGFMLLRQTMRKRRQAKLSEVKAELRRRLLQPIPEQGAYLRSVVGGHVRYYGVPCNGKSIGLFRDRVGWLWWRCLKRRGQAHHLPWRRMEKYIQRWLPLARVCHPWPSQRLRVNTRGKSRMR